MKMHADLHMHLFAMSKNASHAAGYDLLPFLPPKAEHWIFALARFND